jgi:hypothetical protein
MDGSITELVWLSDSDCIVRYSSGLKQSVYCLVQFLGVAAIWYSNGCHCIYLQNEEKKKDEPHSRICSEEENKVGYLCINKTGSKVRDH